MIKRCMCFLFLCLALLSGFPLGLWALESADSAETENGSSSGNALNRLIEISGQLSILNGKLQNELQDSKRSSRELQITLEASKRELDGLRQELEVLRNTSTELLTAAENSQTELTALQGALRKAESSLTSLELSFAAYREVSEKRAAGLEKKNRLLKWGFAAAGILAAGFGTAFFATR